MSHTPGPWLVVPDNTFVGVHVCIKHPTLGLEVPIPCKANALADARLIAAAPDMLDALKAIADYCANHEDGTLSLDILDKAKAVIAKAQGMRP